MTRDSESRIGRGLAAGARRLARAGALGCLLSIVSCLPLDSRAKPGRLTVTVSPDDTLASEFVTPDGWNIGYEQFLLTIGNIQIEGEHIGTPGPARGNDGTCNQYTGETASYLRILDMRQKGPQKVATTYALGTCELGFEVAPPVDELAFGTGVDDAERALMTTSASDPFSKGNPVSVHVAGAATKAGASVRFQWSFRRAFAYSRCATLALEGGDTETVELSVRGGALFQTDLAVADGGAPELGFDAYAAADTDADGEITLVELKAARLPDGGPFDTLADRLYLGLVPRLLASAGGTQCSDRVFPDRPPGGPNVAP